MVYPNAAGGSRIAQSKLNPYVIEGANRIELFLGRATPHFGPEVNVYPPSADIRVLRGEHGVKGGEAALAEYHWKPGTTLLSPGGVALVWGTGIQVDSAFGRWAWESAPEGPLSDEDRAQIAAILEEVHTAVSTGDSNALERLFEIKNRELARALDLPEAELVSSMTRYFETFSGSADKSLEPFVPAELVYNAEAAGRLVRVTDLEGNAPIRGTVDGGDVAIPAALSKIDGRWRIVR